SLTFRRIPGCFRSMTAKLEVGDLEGTNEPCGKSKTCRASRRRSPSLKNNSEIKARNLIMNSFHKIRIGLVIGLLSSLMFLTLTVGATNWPQWRGPGGMGISTETNLPVEWSATKNIKWKTA